MWEPLTDEQKVSLVCLKYEEGYCLRNSSCQKLTGHLDNSLIIRPHIDNMKRTYQSNGEIDYSSDACYTTTKRLDIAGKDLGPNLHNYNDLFPLEITSRLLQFLFTHELLLRYVKVKMFSNCTNGCKDSLKTACGSELLSLPRIRNHHENERLFQS